MARQRTSVKGKRRRGDVSRAETLAQKLSQVAPEEDPAVVAAAIVILATDNIKRSASTLPEARAYLDGMRVAIDGLLVNAFKSDSN